MKKFFIFLLGGFSNYFGNAQTIDSALAKYTANFTPEKAYLHYDKASYFPGETIWFKAYLLEGLYPSEGSKTFYVDWIADNGTVLHHSVSPVVNGGTNGQFDIPADFKGNSIHVVAYTKWMLNFDTAFLYSKDIRILSKTEPGSRKAPMQDISPTISFFPEGGDAITGLSNRIAFKATDQWGRPVRIKGVIVDEKGTIVDSLRPVHDGMGTFTIVPAEGRNYVAKWMDEKGVYRTTALPKAKSTGVAMQLTVDKNRRVLQVSAKENLPDHLKILHLVGTSYGQPAFKTDINLSGSPVARRVIPTDALPTGILTITLFDANWKPVAERITFIRNEDYYFNTNMEVKHWGLGRRKRNEIEITVPENLQEANLSISVTDAAIERDTAENIISGLLLSGDIRGRVYQPSYYFSDSGLKVQTHLDLVMLTHGWRRFNWEEIATGTAPKITYPKDTAYLTLSGQLFGVAKSQLSGTESIVLMIKDTAMRMLIMPIARDGSFGDPGIVLFDTLNAYYSLKSKSFTKAEARFMLGRLPAPNYSVFSKGFAPLNPFYDTTGTYHHSLLAAKAAELDAIRRGKMMETVVVKTKQKSTVEQMEEKYTSGMFRGSDAYQFNLLEDPAALGSLNIFNYLQGRVAGLQVSMGGDMPSLSWRGGSPSLYLDEIQTDASMLSSIPVSDIAYVKVFRPPFLGGFNGANGAIVIYTRKGDEGGRPGTGLSSNKILGYTPVKQFYSPNYDRFDAKNDQLDIRTTLYWNPLLHTTPASRTIRVSFFNNDTAKSFRVVIEGLSKEGLLTHYEQIME